MPIAFEFVIALILPILIFGVGKLVTADLPAETIANTLPIIIFVVVGVVSVPFALRGGFMVRRTKRPTETKQARRARLNAELDAEIKDIYNEYTPAERRQWAREDRSRRLKDDYRTLLWAPGATDEDIEKAYKKWQESEK